jgi:hypothetical protein
VSRPVVLTLALPARQFIALAVDASVRGIPLDDHLRAILAAAAPPLDLAAEAGGDMGGQVDGQEASQVDGQRVVDRDVVDRVAGVSAGA